MFILFQSQMNLRMVKQVFFLGFLERPDSQNSPVVQRLTLFYKELIKPHRGFLLEAWAFLIENIIRPENHCQNELSNTTT